MLLDDLRKEADALGISYPKNIGAEKLQTKIENFNSDKTEPEVETKKVKKPLTQRQEMSRLVRVRVTCNDPQFKKHNGLIRAAGSTTFFRKRFVPFNKITHIENVIYNSMKNAQYQWFEEKINPKNGRKYKIPQSSPAFVIEVLPPLTEEEFNKLAQDQRARGSLED